MGYWEWHPNMNDRVIVVSGDKLEEREAGCVVGMEMFAYHVQLDNGGIVECGPQYIYPEPPRTRLDDPREEEAS